LYSIAISSKINDLIKEGRIEEARQKIAAASTAVRRDGNLLYYQALLEPDGKKSLQFLEAAIKAEIAPQFLEDNVYRQAQYHLAERDYLKLIAIAEAYLQYWEAGRFRPEMVRLAALGYRMTGRNEKTGYYIERLMKENPDNRFGSAGKLDKALGHYQAKEYIQAQNICRRLGNVKYDDITAPALYMLSSYSIEQDRTDDAILYYNILKEGYPHAVGLDELVNLLSGIRKQSNDQRAERLTGTNYSVQVGVFSVKDNAEKLSKRMKQYGQPLEIKQKLISDKKYYVVYVGRFTSSDEAMAFKARLELAENEAYQVVAR
jgi:tetratricopeptide (TPR) repeat protein